MQVCTGRRLEGRRQDGSQQVQYVRGQKLLPIGLVVGGQVHDGLAALLHDAEVFDQYCQSCGTIINCNTLQRTSVVSININTSINTSITVITDIIVIITTIMVTSITVITDIIVIITTIIVTSITV